MTGRGKPRRMTVARRLLSADEFSQLRGRYDPRALRSHSIHTRCYTDDKFLDIEREQIFHRSWQFLCHEEKLRRPGDFPLSCARHLSGRP